MPSDSASSRPVRFVVVHGVVLGMWAGAGLLVGACACVLVAFLDFVPFDDPDRSHLGSSVYSILVWSGIGVGLLSGWLLRPRSTSSTMPPPANRRPGR